ncbi:MAG: FAA hydrolase family protein, partial [Proteobacteria bacterium]
PWTLAKSFSESCPLSDFFMIESLDEVSALDIELKVNGEVRQRGNTSQMIFSLRQQIEYVKAHFPVVEGDLLLTGTPAGVGRVVRGDVLEGTLGKLASYSWKFN